MNYIEIIAVLFTLLSVILTVKGNILCWPMGIIGVTFYSLIFYQHNLYADLGLQFVFFAQSIAGWINWRKPKEELPISWISNQSRYQLLTGMLLMFMLICSFTIRYGGHMPFMDSAITTISITATFLLIKKKIESWILWMINDILLVIVFSLNGLYTSAGIYSIFFILALTGLWKWIKESR